MTNGAILMIKIRRSEERGKADHGWLQSRHTLEPGRTVYVHVVSGVISVNGERLNEGDGAEVKESDVVDFAGIDHTEALVFDLP